MGTISTGVGLFSGLNIQDIVDRLIAIERRPANLLEANIGKKTEVQTALQTLSLSLIATKLTATRLGGASAFLARTASSSSEAIVPTAGTAAATGAFTFTPKRLVSTHQLLSSGFSSEAATVGSGTISVSLGGFVNQSTLLSTLNGGAGIQPGSIRITNRAGTTATIDLTAAVTAADVVEAINNASGLSVTASVDGDSFVLTDSSGGSGSLQVQEVGVAKTAANLGLTSLSQNGNVFTGADVLSLSGGMNLAQTNDGNGVRTVAGLADLRIATNLGTHDINLSSATTVQGVLDAISTQSGGAVTASINGNGISLTAGGGAASISVSALNGSLAAHDLGIEGSGVGAALTGGDILGGIDTVLLNSLQGGYNGGADTLASAGQITISGAASAVIDASSATTLDDVVDLINAETGTTGVSAAINGAGNGIRLSRSGGESFTIADTTGNLAEFLNIDGSSVSGAIDSGRLDFKYVNAGTRLETLNGGVGVPKGKIQLVDGFGNAAFVDLTQDDDVTIGEVINEINGAATAFSLALTARINDSGDGILIEQTGGTGNLEVREVDGGKTAAALNILGTATNNVLDGSFRYTVEVSPTDTLGDVASALANLGAPIQVSILNDGSALSPFRLSIVSKQSGARGKILLDIGATGLSFTESARAQDAILLMGGADGSSVPLQISSRSNTFSNVVAGLDLDVKQASGIPATVTVSQNETSIVDAVKAFVDSFNSARKLIADNSKFDSESGERGILFTDSTARLADNMLSRFITSEFGPVGASIATAGEVGITLNSDGQLEFDESAFRAAFRADPAGVEQFFTSTNNGFSDRFEALADVLTDVNGILTSRTESLALSIERQNQTLGNMEDRLDARRDFLLRQFFSLETALAQLQSQQTALNQLAQLATITRSNTR